VQATRQDAPTQAQVKFQLIPIQREHHAWHAEPFGSAQGRLRAASRRTPAETLRCAQGDTMRHVHIELVSPANCMRTATSVRSSWICIGLLTGWYACRTIWTPKSGSSSKRMRRRSR
jgi:hypothetical protein